TWTTVMHEARPRAEFDSFAPDYDGGMGDPLKRLFGGTADVFLEHKADWLRRNLAPAGRLLDLGCGAAGFLRALRRSGAPLELVGRAAIDANAELLSAAECTRLLSGAGAGACRSRYILFFPPRFRRLRAAERALAWLPIGGQYVTVGIKPS